MAYLGPKLEVSLAVRRHARGISALAANSNGDYAQPARFPEQIMGSQAESVAVCEFRKFRPTTNESKVPFGSLVIFICLLLSGCGGGGGTGGGGAPPPNVPSLSAIAPSTTVAGASSIVLSLYGSNFESAASVEWNGTQLKSSWVSATQMNATIPTSNLSAAGSAQVTVVNPSPGGGTSAGQTFTILANSSYASTWIRTVPGITVPNDVVWDGTHGNLYVSVSSNDPTNPNVIAIINPLTGTVGSTIQAGSNPDLLSISSDSSYLWAALDGGNSVRRFLLPGFAKDISFSLPPNTFNIPSQAVSLLAAPASPHTVALVLGNWGESPPGDGVYIYDDATQRPTFVPGSWGTGGGPFIDWIQWGGNDSTIYGNQYFTIDQGGIATLDVTSSGVSFVAYKGGQAGPALTQYDTSNGLLYSFGAAFNPVNGSLVSTFDVPDFNPACTADASLNRYFCVVAYPVGGTDVSNFELWVFNLNTYALLDRVYFGSTQGTEYSPLTGTPNQLVRWGNAGLAVTTFTGTYVGTGGVFLIDGAAVNPNVAPDSSSGTASQAYTWITSLTPQQSTTTSNSVNVTIDGSNFTKTSTACVNCNYLQFEFLPTTYVSSTQLSVTIPVGMLATSGPLPISIFDGATNLFSSNALAFTAGSPSSDGGQVTALNLAGLGMAWDGNSQLLYVGTADYDGAYPNSIVAINAGSGAVAHSQNVGSDPSFLSVSANGQYLYTAFAATTEMTQLELPGLNSPLAWALNNPLSSEVYWPGDMKAAPVSPHTTAVALLDLDSMPAELGGVVIFDDNVLRHDFALYNPSYPYDTVAWGGTDEILTASQVPLSIFQVTPSGVSSVVVGPTSFNDGDLMHEDFGTGFIYSEAGNVADPSTQAQVGTYGASGLVAPDSTLNSVFILGQTASQVNTNNYTIDSFNESAYTAISSITLTNLLGTPIELVRWGTSGLAMLTANQNGGPAGMLYLIQAPNFVTNTQTVASLSSPPQELVQRRWKAPSKADILRTMRERNSGSLQSGKNLSRRRFRGVVGVPSR